MSETAGGRAHNVYNEGGLLWKVNPFLWYARDSYMTKDQDLRGAILEAQAVAALGGPEGGTPKHATWKKLRPSITQEFAQSPRIEE